MGKSKHCSPDHGLIGETNAQSFETWFSTHSRVYERAMHLVPVRCILPIMLDVGSSGDLNPQLQCWFSSFCIDLSSSYLN
jgi:hypothetical protein